MQTRTSHIASRALMEKAQALMPGGVSSPVRAFKAVGGDPVFVDRAEGAYIYDVDGNQYIDYIGSWGPMIAGHAHPDVTSALEAAIKKGTSYGMPIAAEAELAQLITERVPSIEMVRFVNSGTEATMSALRLARAATNRDIILKFDGCYHGHSDSLLVAAGSGVLTLNQPDSPGVPESLAKLTLSVPYNDLDAARLAFDSHPDRIAAVIVEPVGGNMGVVTPEQGFLEDLQGITQANGALLILDEVMTGFRVARGGAQELYNIQPDLTTLGKVIGGGLPVGAYGGRRDLMEMISPSGPVYQAGTLSGNPLAMAAGLATLNLIGSPDVYSALERTSARLEDELEATAREAGVPVCIGRSGSMLTVFFRDGKVRNFQDAKGSDTERFARFHQAMLREGVNLPPSQFEAWFISLAHTDEDIERTIEAAQVAMKSM